MSVTELAHKSHTDPSQFRISYEDAVQVLGPDPSIPKDDTLPTLYSKSEIAIIGGGFSGMVAALTCNKINTKQSRDFVIFDKHANFGGTWFANTYPGCASDIPALLYSFSQELNNNWSELRPPQYEMEEYMLQVAQKHGLERHSHFRTVITRAVYSDENSNWTVTARNLATGQRIVHTSKILISGQGQLVTPNQLKAKGLENFKGVYMHSAIWNHEVSFKNKKVVVVGNGCSAAQVVPELLRKYEVESIHQIARTKHYIMPPLPPITYLLYQLASYSRYTLYLMRLIVASVAECRWPLYKGDGILARMVRWVNTRKSVNYMKTAPEKYHHLLIPDYKVGCKRLIFDYRYIPSLHDPRMHLTGHEIDHITGNSVVLSDGTELEADIIVACTGYNINKSLSTFELIGRNGVDARKVWNDDGITAYKTVMIRDCPNFFLIAGPNCATGHSSVELACENCAAYFERIAPKILSGAYKSVCVKTKAYYDWFNEIQGELKNAVFGTPFGGCYSWYASDSYNPTTYPYSQIFYWWDMRHPKWDDFDVETDPNYLSQDSKLKQS